MPASSQLPSYANVFHTGAMVLISLANPREKFWGALLALDPAGISVSGIDLQSFDDSAALVKNGEAFTPSAIFLPMHRVERMELDAREGDIPSLRDRFTSKSGRDPAELFLAIAPESQR